MMIPPTFKRGDGIPMSHDGISNFKIRPCDDLSYEHVTSIPQLQVFGQTAMTCRYTNYGDFLFLVLGTRCGVIFDRRNKAITGEYVVADSGN